MPATATRPSLPSRARSWLPLGLVLAWLLAPPAGVASRAPDRGPKVEELVLDNGMRFLLVPRPEAATVGAAWVVGVGSAADGPGRSGLSHLLEHLMFQGTRTVGARDADREDAVLGRLDEVDAVIRRLGRSAGATAELARLAERRRRLAERARGLADPGELLRLYAEAGAREVEAVTYRDFTLYFAHLPASRLELWFWLESDRLLEPVFRSLGAERQVVLAERRRRLEADPTGRGQEELMARFFAGHPYGAPAQGRPEDLERVGRAEVRDFFRRYYRPPNLTAALVGPVDRDRVRDLASRYFGRLEGGPVEEPAVPEAGGTGEEVRIEASCAGRSQLHLLFHSVPFGDPDGYALEVLAGVLNGRTGRLYRELVEERELAFSAYALQHPLRQAGYFSVWIEGRGGVGPDQLLEGWEGVVARLGSRPPSGAELERVRHQVAADSFRRLRDPLALARQLLVYEALGGWRRLVESRDRLETVDAGEVVDVARRFLVPDRRAVALYRGEGGEAGPSGTGAR